MKKYKLVEKEIPEYTLPLNSSGANIDSSTKKSVAREQREKRKRALNSFRVLVLRFVCGVTGAVLLGTFCFAVWKNDGQLRIGHLLTIGFFVFVCFGYLLRGDKFLYSYQKFVHKSRKRR